MDSPHFMFALYRCEWTLMYSVCSIEHEHVSIHQHKTAHPSEKKKRFELLAQYEQKR